MFWAKKTNYFLEKKIVLDCKTKFSKGKPKKDGFFLIFGARTNLFLVKNDVFLGKTNKTIFLESGRIVSQKIVFFLFPLRKVDFSV